MSQDATTASQPGHPQSTNSSAVHAQPTVHRTAQWVLLLCIAASLFCFWWVGELLSIPRYRGFGASLLRQPGVGGSVVTVIVAAVMMLSVTVLVGLLLRRYWLFAGPLAAAAGLSAWSFRGGPSYFAFIADAPAQASTGAMNILALECLLFGIILAGVWWLIYQVFYSPADAKEQPFSFVPNGATLQAILTQTVLTALGVILIVQAPVKQQAVFGVLAASLIATGLTRYFFDSKAHAQWCWLAPILVGLIGYIVNGMGETGRLAIETGQLAGTFGALSRPLPLDYASAGIVGALMGLAMTTHEPEHGK